LTDIRAVHGVGDKRLADYGEAFLACITNFIGQSASESDTADTARDSASVDEDQLAGKR